MKEAPKLTKEEKDLLMSIIVTAQKENAQKNPKLCQTALKLEEKLIKILDEMDK